MMVAYTFYRAKYGAAETCYRSSMVSDLPKLFRIPDP